jgi:hypothetical protein
MMVGNKAKKEPPLMHRHIAMPTRDRQATNTTLGIATYFFAGNLYHVDEQVGL